MAGTRRGATWVPAKPAPFPLQLQGKQAGQRNHRLHPRWGLPLVCSKPSGSMGNGKAGVPRAWLTRGGTMQKNWYVQMKGEAVPPEGQGDSRQ